MTASVIYLVYILYVYIFLSYTWYIYQVHICIYIVRLGGVKQFVSRRVLYSNPFDATLFLCVFFALKPLIYSNPFDAALFLCVFFALKPLSRPVDILENQCPCRFFNPIMERYELRGHQTTPQQSSQRYFLYVFMQHAE